MSDNGDGEASGSEEGQREEELEEEYAREQKKKQEQREAARMNWIEVNVGSFGQLVAKLLRTTFLTKEMRALLEQFGPVLQIAARLNLVAKDKKSFLWTDERVHYAWMRYCLCLKTARNLLLLVISFNFISSSFSHSFIPLVSEACSVGRLFL